MHNIVHSKRTLKLFSYMRYFSDRFTKSYTKTFFYLRVAKILCRLYRAISFSPRIERNKCVCLSSLEVKTLISASQLGLEKYYIFYSNSLPAAILAFMM